MKTCLKALGLVAVAATALFGCAKPFEQDLPLTHRVTIRFADDATKTEIVEGGDVNTFKWSPLDGDRFTVLENDQVAKSVELVTEDQYVTVALNVEFDVTDAAYYTYNATLAASYEDGIATLPSGQITSSTTYDPDADILVAKPLGPFEEAQDNLVMRFKRPVAISKMTLTGLNPGEVISNVTISSESNMVGSYDIENDEWTGTGDTIELAVNEEVSEAGEISVFFVTMPVENVQLTITASSDENFYSKTFAEGSLISFPVNMVTRFSVAMHQDTNIPVNIADFDEPEQILVSANGSTDADLTVYETLEGYTGQTTTADQEVDLTYTLTGDEIGEVDSATGEVTLNGTPGTAVVTASFDGEDPTYLPAEPKSYTIVVKEVKKATLAIPSNTPITTTSLTDDQENEWTTAFDANKMSIRTDLDPPYTSFGSNSNTSNYATSISFSSDAFSAAEIKKIGTTAGGSSNGENPLTATIFIGDTLLEEFGDLNTTSEGTSCVVDNDDEESGTVSVVISRPEQEGMTKIYFQFLFVVYIADPE